MYLNNLASRYALRYEKRADDADVMRAIRLGESSLNVVIGESHHPEYQMNLASIYRKRYAFLRHRRDLDRAIELAHDKSFRVEFQTI